ncbi:hypothetical protein ACFQ1M_04055 [Sungkyunkwania multivorans]|uniref:Lipoprotein n=1 Tax=Sungkyunkwania multivorans TaxID=1173618 RepID=A0ABW3CVP7_9FLAO
MKKLATIVLISVTILGCSSDESSSEQFIVDGIIFGEIYGFCAGDCIELYLLDDENIYKDADGNTQYGNWEDTAFERTPLSVDAFTLAQSLLEIPAALLTTDEPVGNQTIADFDYYLHINRDGVIKTFIFDEPMDGVSTSVKEYLEELINVSDQLSEN